MLGGALRFSHDGVRKSVGSENNTRTDEGSFRLPGSKRGFQRRWRHFGTEPGLGYERAAILDAELLDDQGVPALVSGAPAGGQSDAPSVTSV